MLPLAFVVTGAPAVIIILVILAVFVLGIIKFFQLSARGVKHVSEKATDPRSSNR